MVRKKLKTLQICRNLWVKSYKKLKEIGSTDGDERNRQKHYDAVAKSNKFKGNITFDDNKKTDCSKVATKILGMYDKLKQHKNYSYKSIIKV